MAVTRRQPSKRAPRVPELPEARVRHAAPLPVAQRVTGLQRAVGNRAVARLLSRRGVVQRTREDAMRMAFTQNRQSVVDQIKDTDIDAGWRLDLLRVNNYGLAASHQDHIAPNDAWFPDMKSQELAAALKEDITQTWRFRRAREAGANGGEVKERGATEVTPQNIRTLFYESMRRGVGKAAGLVGMTDRDTALREAMTFATITYGNIVSGLNMTLGKGRLPTAEEILRKSPDTWETFITDTAAQIEKDEKIEGAGWDLHVDAKTVEAAEKQTTLEAMQIKYHHDARRTVAANWAQAAMSLVKVRDRARKAVAVSKPGRDLPGRLAYRLLQAPPETVAKHIVGADTGETASLQTGSSQLLIDLSEVFHEAACHHDAQETIDLMSDQIVNSNTEKFTFRDADKAAKSILSALEGCQAPKKLLKLTVAKNHSAVYLIGSGSWTQYQTHAAQDSKSESQNILYNDVIDKTQEIRQADVGALLLRGIESLSAEEGDTTLKWEVHRAVRLEQLQERLERRLGRGMTEVGMGLAVAALAKEREAADIGMEIKTLTDALGRYKKVTVPLPFLNHGPDLFEQGEHKQADPSKLTVGTPYRMKTQHRWVQLVYRGPAADKTLPSWMQPAGTFEVLEASGRFANPHTRLPEKGERPTTLNQFITDAAYDGQFARGDLLEALERPSSSDYKKQWGKFVIVDDPFWKTGDVNRRILVKDEKE